MKSFEDVVKYWFECPNDYKKWFFGGSEQDNFITLHYKNVLDTTIQHFDTIIVDELTSIEYLGLIILLDQFSRHIYRGKAKAFQQDKMALQLSKNLLLHKKMHLYSSQEQLFALLPLQHSEIISDNTILLDYVNQQLATCSSENKNTFNALLEHTIGHQKVLQQFGRYPKRNKALGRVSTSAECKYIESTTNPY